MTYSTFISKIRTELSDFGKIHTETFDGDASTKSFVLNFIPIKDASYVVKVGGVTKTETTDYSVNKDTGVIVFVSAPAAGSDNIEVSYQSIKIRDEDYIEIINDAIDHFRWKFWKEADDNTTFESVADQYEYDLSALTGIIYVIHAWYKTSSDAGEWQEVQGLTNWKYLKRQEKLYVNPTFDTSDLPMKIRYLKSFTKGTATTDTLDIPDEWLLPYKFYIKARFFEQQIAEKVSETAAITTIPSYTPAQVMFQIAENYYKKADDVANKLAPKLPSLPIKNLSEGISL